MSFYVVPCITVSFTPLFQGPPPAPPQNVVRTYDPCVSAMSTGVSRTGVVFFTASRALPVVFPGPAAPPPLPTPHQTFTGSFDPQDLTLGEQREYFRQQLSHFAGSFDSQNLTLDEQRNYFLQHPDEFQQEIDEKCQLLKGKRNFPLPKKYKSALCVGGSKCERGNKCHFAHTYTALIASNLVLVPKPTMYKRAVCEAGEKCCYLQNKTCRWIHPGDPMLVLDPIYNRLTWTFYDPSHDQEQTVLGVARSVLGADVPHSALHPEKNRTRRNTPHHGRPKGH
jgi:hypothetical protein